MSQKEELPGSMGGSSLSDSILLSESPADNSHPLPPILSCSLSANLQSWILEIYHKPREKNYSRRLEAFDCTWRTLFRADEKHKCGGVFLDCQDATNVKNPHFSKLVSFSIYVFRNGTNEADEDYIYKLDKTFRFEHTKVGQPMKNNHGAYNFLSKEDFIAGTGFVDPVTKKFKIKVVIDDDQEKANKKEQEKKEKQKKKEKERNKGKDDENSQSQSQIQDPSKSFVTTVGEIKFVDLSKSKDGGPQGSELLKAAADAEDGAATVPTVGLGESKDDGGLPKLSNSLNK